MVCVNGWKPNLEQRLNCILKALLVSKRRKRGIPLSFSLNKFCVCYLNFTINTAQNSCWNWICSNRFTVKYVRSLYVLNTFTVSNWQIKQVKWRSLSDVFCNLWNRLEKIFEWKSRKHPLLLSSLWDEGVECNFFFYFFLCVFSSSYRYKWIYASCWNKSSS